VATTEAKHEHDYAVSRASASRAGELLERSIFWFYLGGLAWAPGWYGSNDLVAWGLNAVVFCGLTGFYELSLLIRGKRHPVGIRNLGVPAAMFAAVVLWIIAQRSTLLPSTFANPIWAMAADSLGRPVAGSISVNRDLTELALIRLITAASAFWLGLQLCRDATRAAGLIMALAAIGGCYAVYGLVALKTGQPAWLDIPSDGGRVTATFVNHNSFATFAGLTLVAVVGLLLDLYQREVIVGRRWRLWLASLIEVSGQRGAILVAGAFVIVVGLLLTGSRGGLLATGVGLVALVVLMARRHRHRRRRQLLAPMLLGLVLLAAMLFGFGGMVLGNLDEHGISDASRLSIYLLTWRSILDAPLLGFGYGTFADVFPLYRDRSISVIGVWGQAHDTYLELFQGLGLVFGALLIAAVALLAWRCIQGAARRRHHRFVPAVAASGACLVGVHAVVDFSLQIQAITLCLMALLGAGVAQSESVRIVLAD